MLQSSHLNALSHSVNIVTKNDVSQKDKIHEKISFSEEFIVKNFTCKCQLCNNNSKALDWVNYITMLTFKCNLLSITIFFYFILMLKITVFESLFPSQTVTSIRFLELNKKIPTIITFNGFFSFNAL